MRSKKSAVSKQQTFKNLGQVAKQIGISRTYLAERLHTELPGHADWPPLQKMGGAYVPGTWLLVARLAKLNPRPVYSVAIDPSATESFAMVDVVAFALAALVGCEGDDPRQRPRLDGVELVALLRAAGDTLTAALSGLRKPPGYGEEVDGIPEAM